MLDSEIIATYDALDDAQKVKYHALDELDSVELDGMKQAEDMGNFMLTPPTSFLKHPPILTPSILPMTVVTNAEPKDLLVDVLKRVMD
jgi:hypothetical protein